MLDYKNLVRFTFEVFFYQDGDNNYQVSFMFLRLSSVVLKYRVLDYAAGV